MPADGNLPSALRGYDAEQVDALLARCARSLGSRAQEFAALAGAAGPVRDPRPVTGDDVRLARFDKRLRGYAAREVDDLLDRIADRLDQRSAP